MSTLEEITKEALPKPEWGEFAWENFTEDYRQGLQLFAVQVMRGFVERVRLRAESYKANRTAPLPSAYKDAAASILAECAVEMEGMNRENSNA